MTSAGFKEGLHYTENVKAVIEKFIKMKQTPIQAEGRNLYLPLGSMATLRALAQVDWGQALRGTATASTF